MCGAVTDIMLPDVPKSNRNTPITVLLALVLHESVVLRNAMSFHNPYIRPGNRHNIRVGVRARGCVRDLRHQKKQKKFPRKSNLPKRDVNVETG